MARDDLIQIKGTITEALAGGNYRVKGDNGMEFLAKIGGRYAVGDIRRWLLVFLERFFANQFKRDCVPDAPKVGSGGSLSPRGDWRMPSDASVAAWLAEAKAIPESLDQPRAVPRATRAASDRRTR